MITYSTDEQRFVDSCITVYNKIPYPKPDFNSWVGTAIEQMFESWRDEDKFDFVTVGTFMARNPEAFAQIAADRPNNPILQPLMARIESSPGVWLASIEARQAVSYLQQAGYLSQEEAIDILYYERPTIVPPT